MTLNSFQAKEDVQNMLQKSRQLTEKTAVSSDDEDDDEDMEEDVIVDDLDGTEDSSNPWMTSQNRNTSNVQDTKVTTLQEIWNTELELNSGDSDSEEEGQEVNMQNTGVYHLKLLLYYKSYL